LRVPHRPDETRRTVDLGHSSHGPSWIDLAEIRVNTTESRFAACLNRLLQQNLPVAEIAAPTAHLYLWCPNALLPEGIQVMKAWGFQYKSNIVWHKIRKDGGSDGRGVGFYFRNVTELILFGVRGKNARTLQPGRTQVNYISSRKREHSRKPDEQYEVIESCSPGPYLELFSRGVRKKWAVWGNEAHNEYRPTWDTYANHSQAAE
ncbi:MT-A70 family methyltransferase, partial [Bradyrhizobium sp. WSM2254]|uniref:MT-A70 family methyltransferase n=1 Tax=Bradyrhizobium sp. WSM2254 TaxID=1188263 RepID=UPI001FD8A236